MVDVDVASCFSVSAAEPGIHRRKRICACVSFECARATQGPTLRGAHAVGGDGAGDLPSYAGVLDRAFFDNHFPYCRTKRVRVLPSRITSQRKCYSVPQNHKSLVSLMTRYLIHQSAFQRRTCIGQVHDDVAIRHYARLGTLASVCIRSTQYACIDAQLHSNKTSLLHCGTSATEEGHMLYVRLLQAYCSARPYLTPV
jgi:hypothetical protein